MNGGVFCEYKSYVSSRNKRRSNIKYYNEKRIQQKLGYQSPVNFRKQAA
ncbi:IS3 family transposase [Listeria seeligeri]